jgi:hypothetical protein
LVGGVDELLRELLCVTTDRASPSSPGRNQSLHDDRGGGVEGRVVVRVKVDLYRVRGQGGFHRLPSGHPHEAGEERGRGLEGVHPVGEGPVAAFLLLEKADGVGDGAVGVDGVVAVVEVSEG